MLNGKCLIVLLQLLVEEQSVCDDHYSPHYLLPIFSQILKVTDTTTIRRQIESDTALPSYTLEIKT